MPVSIALALLDAQQRALAVDIGDLEANAHAESRSIIALPRQTSARSRLGGLRKLRLRCASQLIGAGIAYKRHAYKQPPTLPSRSALSQREKWAPQYWVPSSPIKYWLGTTQRNNMSALVLSLHPELGPRNLYQHVASSLSR